MKTEKMLKLRERLCKGCDSSIRNNTGCTACVVPINKYGKICPCSICLIKIMCNTSCKLFKDFVH